MNREKTNCRCRKKARGLMQIEVVIAALLLGAVITGVVGLNYRLLGVAKDTKHYQLALHEAANQIGWLSAGGLDGLDQRIAQVKLSEDVASALPDGKLDVQRVDDPSGTKVLVKIHWQRPGMPTSVELTGWVSTKEVLP